MTEQKTDDILTERKKSHGEFRDHARCTQSIVRALQAEKGWADLPDIAKESLHMIAHKMGRVVTGTWDHADHWVDIEGYSRLVTQRIADPDETQFRPYAAESDLYKLLGERHGLSRKDAKQLVLEALYKDGLLSPASTRADIEAAVASKVALGQLTGTPTHVPPKEMVGTETVLSAKIVNSERLVPRHNPPEHHPLPPHWQEGEAGD